MGWPSLVEEVARVWDGLPPGQRAYAVIITSDYGEAGAIQRFGPALGLPTPYSGHNSYWWWATPPAGTTTVVFVGYPNDDELRRFFATVGSPDLSAIRTGLRTTSTTSRCGSSPILGSRSRRRGRSGATTTDRSQRYGT